MTSTVADREFVPRRVALQHYRVDPRTLTSWCAKGLLEFRELPGGQKRYAICTARTDSKISIVYCRVSSAKQKDDLRRQKAAMSAAYPGHLVISDVGSGLNFNRPNLRALLERSMRGEVAEVVVSHRDRLARFATELIEWILRLHGTRLVVQHQVLETPESELVADLLAIVTVFACRSHGRRRYKRPAQGQEAQGV